MSTEKKFKDPEIMALAEAFSYLDKAEDRDRERFIYHLNHKYFPEGEFNPHGNRFIFNPEDLKK